MPPLVPRGGLTRNRLLRYLRFISKLGGIATNLFFYMYVGHPIAARGVTHIGRAPQGICRSKQWELFEC